MGSSSMITHHIAQALDAAARGDDDARWEHVISLHRDGSRQALLEALRLSTSDLPAERQLGADVLGQLGGTDRRLYALDSIPAISKLLHDTEPEVISSAVSALGHLRHEIDPSTLTSLVAHSSEDVRFALAIALPSCGGALAGALLIQLMEDASDDVRNWATFGLGTTLDDDSPEIREALLQRTGDSHDETRCEALVGLGARRDLRVLEPLLRELRAESVGTLAVEAARDIGLPELLPALEALAGWWDADPALLSEATAACRRGV